MTVFVVNALASWRIQVEAPAEFHRGVIEREARYGGIKVQLITFLLAAKALKGVLMKIDA